MLSFLPTAIVAIIATILLLLNVFFWCPILLLVALIKVLIPVPFLRTMIDPILIKIAEGWVLCNSGWMKLTQGTQWDVQGLGELKIQGLVPCKCKPPILGGYISIATRVQWQNSITEIFSKKRTHQGANHGVMLVGIGFSIHATF